MNTKLRLSSLLIGLFTLTGFSQTIASTAGIAVQGIARDANNTARVNQAVSLTFKIYYLNGPNEATVLNVTETLITDAFGVFSYILNPAPEQNAVIANFICYLRISEGANVITDETLKAVPYAIASANGVPTGSIMPFVGTKADMPAGWAFCDGTETDLGAIPGSERLIALLGSSNPPDLRGLFLRGAGNNSIVPTLNATLGSYHNDTFGSHNHSFNLTASNAGLHSHSVFITNNPQTSVTNGAAGPRMQPNGGSISTSSNGTHSHNVTGSINNTGSGETRPDHYGVNYIIKL